MKCFKDHPNILAVQSMYKRVNEDNKIIGNWTYCDTAITYSKKIINLIGYYCDTRFGGFGNIPPDLEKYIYIYIYIQ